MPDGRRVARRRDRRRKVGPALRDGPRGARREAAPRGQTREQARGGARAGIEAALAADARRRGKAFDVVVEASGAATGFHLALDVLDPQGTLVLKSTFHGATPVDAARVVVDEIRVVGSRCGRFAPALSLLARRAVDVASLISEALPLDAGVEAMRRAGAPGVLKVLLAR
jgi:threonine dehydrogenase-like Zn-dependent dehydrogenase